MQSDPSPIVIHKHLDNSFNSATPDRVDKSQYPQFSKAKSNYSERGGNSTGVMYQNSPIQQTNEGKLIKKLGEKQKMLEKYEKMLQKVNIEFQNTLTKNKELADQISKLELRCLRAEDSASMFQGKVSGDQYVLQRQLDELILEKDDLQSDNVSLNKLLKNKNMEIDELIKARSELENRLINHNMENTNITKNEAEYRLTIDQLKKRIIALEFEIKKKDEDYRIDISNCDLIAQSVRSENEQLIIQRNELTDQNTKYKEQIWKDNFITRQVNNENDNLKRENINLRNTAELAHENEIELKNDNKILREQSLSTESKCLAYQKVISQNDKLYQSIVENLERSVKLLRSSEEINRGLVTVNIERIIDDVRNSRIRSSEVPIQSYALPPASANYYPQQTSITRDFNIRSNPLSMSQDVFSPQRMEIDFSNQMKDLR